MKTTYIECDCYDDEHLIRLSYLSDEEFPELYMSYFLQEESFWNRVKLASKFIFGYKCKYGHFGCTEINRENAIKFRNVLNEFLTDIQIIEEENKYAKEN